MKRAVVLTYLVCVNIVSIYAQCNYYSIDPQEEPIMETCGNNAFTGFNKSTTSYADNSVLAEGKWVKVRVKSGGIKRISKTLLAKMGFTDLSTIAIYGNGREVLSMKTNNPRPDDLQKVCVYRTENAILFYANDGRKWSYNTCLESASCEVNDFEDYTYYYITNSKEPSVAPTEYICNATPTASVNVYDYRYHHELRNNNILSSGSRWFGEKFNKANPIITFDLPIPPRPDTLNYVFINASFAVRSSSTTSYAVTYNGSTLNVVEVRGVNTSSTTDNYATLSEYSNFLLPSRNTSNKLELKYLYRTASDFLWLDKFTVVSKTALDMAGNDELDFRYIKTFPQKEVEDIIEIVAQNTLDKFNDKIDATCVEYVLSGANESTVVWNVIDHLKPSAIKTSYTNGKLHFVHEGYTYTDFIAFNPNGKFEEPELVGEVPNQNLHALPAVNYAIIYHADFKEQAERLAELHRIHSKISVVTVDAEQIYNEFSSGRKEATAIRDFLRMLYKRGTGDNNLRYALLFGDGSYDNLRYPENTTNKIPTYQSLESITQSSSYVTDDFFGWVGDNSGNSERSSRMKIGIGRFPCQTQEEATAAVDKSERYLTNLDLGNWKNTIVVTADDGDKCEHISYAESVSNIIENKYPDIDLRRIYTETYAADRTSTGIIYTKAHEDFMSSINSGCLVLNYVGHGGYNALTDEGLFKMKNIEEWTNKNRLPFFITATCDFAPFDKNIHYSAGEASFFYPNGGFIGLFTTTRLVYGNNNNRIHKAMYELLLDRKPNGERYTIGEAAMNAKVAIGGVDNSLKFMLIGDPAIALDFGSEYYVATEKINGEAIDTTETPVSALKQNTISGTIRNNDNSICNSFNGQVLVTLYDKRITKTMTGPISGMPFSYEENGNILYSGLVPVVNGHFEAAFVLSKDIDFEIGYGRVSYYAYSTDSIEASGSLNTILVGGVSDSVLEDADGPQIAFWIDYPEFVDGGTTGPNPTVHARIEDISGINTSGLGVGHNISICIDGDRENAINVNSAFSYDLGSYTSGTLSYQLPSLPDGEHTISIKAWDNMNNSNTKQLKIISNVKTSISFGQIELYPQPFIDNNSMKLQFTHNCGGGNLTLNFRLYSINGQLISLTSSNVTASGTQVDEISLDEHCPAIKTLPSGIYFIEVIVTNNGRKGSFVKKIAIKTQ